MKSQIREEKSLREEIGKVLTGFEEMTGLLICVRALTDRWRDSEGRLIIPEKNLLHRSDLCVRVKARSLERCMRCDLHDLPTVCRPRRGPFIRRCHAGVDEILVPLWADGVLTGVVFLGQFSQRTTLTVAGVPVRRVAPTRAQHLRLLSVAIRSYLIEVLRQLEHSQQQHTTGRKRVIENFVRQTLQSGPTLAALARGLNLSPSRASHVVKEVTGLSLAALVEKQRLKVARDLLVESQGKIAWVAAQSGFADVAYFCRYFKSRTGMTPSQFRSRRGKPAGRV